MRKVLVPIQIKLMSFFIVVLAAAISFYVYYAINLFEKDKAAYVFETVMQQNESKATILKEIIHSNAKEVGLLDAMAHSTHSLKNIFNQNKDLLAFIHIGRGKITQSVIGEELEKADKNIWKKITEQLLVFDKQQVNSATKFVSRGQFFIEQGQNYLISWQHNTKGTSFALYRASVLLDKINESILYRYAIIDDKNHKSFKEKNQTVVETFLNKKSSLGVQTGTFVEKLASKRYITAYENIAPHLYLLCLVEESKAYEAGELMIKRSVYFGLFVLSITILLVMLFSKVFTRPIRLLFEATQNFAKNNFKHRINLNNKDELGVLADSFNDMSASIVDYMEQMKEKHRLENEMQTAKLVQDSFMPEQHFKTDHFSLSSFYYPATECGGDWWGKFEQEDKLVFMMIDATGHGTPAALVTAMTFNAFSTLKYMAHKDSSLLEHPEQMMAMVNQSLCEIHQDMLATAFIGVVDTKKKELVYCNASHNPPLIIKYKNAERTKEDLIPLMEALGKRLGEDANESYVKAQRPLANHDIIILYTDGLLEGENPEGKMWGKRNFYKQLMHLAPFGPEVLVEKTVANAYEFYQEHPQGDDITLVGIELK